MIKNDEILELKRKIEEKKNKIKELKNEADEYNAMQLALKLVMNGSYGAFANKHFVCFCNGVASTITAHGRDLTRTMSKKNEEYWYKLWHEDYETHKEIAKYGRLIDYIENNLYKYDYTKNDILYNTRKSECVELLAQIKKEIDYDNLDNLDIPNVEKIESNYINSSTKEKCTFNQTEFNDGTINRENPVSVYADTDSVFVGFKPAMESFGWDKDPLDFILFVSKYKLQPYFKEKLDEYAGSYGVTNEEDFELEQISKSIIFLQKKMYVKNVIWDEGVFNNPEENLQAKGIDLVRSSSPSFVREYVPKIIKYFFENPDTYNDRELVRLVREIKDVFKIQPIENISTTSSCSKYKENVIDDQSSLLVKKGAHFAVKAGAFHNYLLNNNTQYKTKYDTIKQGQKVKLYYTTSKVNSVFAYINGSYPREIADKYAPIDIDTQFEKTILGIVNRFGDALGLSKLDSKLTFTLSLF